MKRFAAMLAVSVMVLWIASGDRMSAGQRTDGLYYEVTGIHPDAVLMRINGEDISAEEYLYWLAYDCEYLTSYVPNLDFSAEVSNGMTYGSYAKADAVETVKLYALLRQWAKQYNVSLTEEDEARLQQQRQQYVTYYGGEEGYHQRGYLRQHQPDVPAVCTDSRSVYRRRQRHAPHAGGHRRLRSGKGLRNGEAAVLARLRR